MDVIVEFCEIIRPMFYLVYFYFKLLLIKLRQLNLV